MFFNVVATASCGNKNDILQQAETFYGQAKISINANPLNGNLFVKDFSKTFIEQGFPFELGYQYNSQAERPWKLNQGRVIGGIEGQPNQINSFVLVEEADGSQSTYTYDTGRGCYVSLAAADGAPILTYSLDGRWSGWEPSNNIQETYNHNNQLEKITDDSGNYLSYSYDNYERLTCISGISGPKVAIEYDSRTTRIYSLDGDKKELVMSSLFDENNRLEKTVVLVNEQEHYEINYTYSGPLNLLESITQSDTTEVTFAYNQDRITCLENGVENKFRLSYKTNATQLIDPLGMIKTFDLNESGLLKKYTDQEQSQTYLYDASSRVQSIRYQDDSIQERHYNALGFISELTGRGGEKTLYTHDATTGLLRCSTQVAESERQLNTFYIYNDKKELIFQIMPQGGVHAYGYDEHGNCTRETVYLKALFDLGNLTKDSVISPDTLKNWCAQQDPNATALSESTYNAYGLKISQTTYATITPDGTGVHDNFAAYQEYEWTIHGERLTKKTKLNEQETAVESIEYDGLSRAKKVVNPLGQVTLHRYEKNQQQSTFEPTGLVSTTTWDESGSVIEKEKQSAEGAARSTLLYDNAGRVCIIYNEDGEKEYIVHDEHNRLRYQIDSLLRITQNSYDTNNRLMHQFRYSSPLSNIDEFGLQQGTWSPEPGGDCCIESTIYNASGQLLYSINGDNFVTEHRYDALGNRIKTIEYAIALNLTQEQRAALTFLSDISETEHDRLHQYFYNDASQLIAEQIPLGQVIAYDRNTQGELLNKRTTLAALPVVTHWNESLVASVPHKTERFKLDARGLCLEQINEEQIATTHIFDAAGRLIESSCGGETDVSAWDVMNRLTKEYRSTGLEVSRSYASCGKMASETKRDLIAGNAPRSMFIRYNDFGQATHELTPRVALKLSDPVFAADPSLVESLWQNESVRHTHNLAGLKISTQDELGNSSYYYYNKAHELCVTVNPTGTITEYTHEAIFHQCESTHYYARCLEEEELATLTGGILTPELIALFHNYQSEDDALECIKYNKRGLVSLAVDAEQFITQKKYDAFNNVTALQQQIDDENQLVSNMGYDKADRPLIKIQDVGGINAKESWEYRDDANLVIYKDANKNEHKTYHDFLNRKIKEVDALNRETTFAWDALSRLEETTDALKNKTTSTYENHGRKIITNTPLSSSVIEKNAFNEIEIRQNADGEVWQELYGVDGQVETKIDPDGHSYTYAYNTAGWLTDILDPLNKKTRYIHTKSGHVEQQIEVGLNEERTLTFKRDSQGRELLRTDENKIPTQTIYDKRGLETDKIIDPEGVALRTHHDYDGLGHSVREIKGSHDYPNQLFTQTVRDKLGRERHTIIDPDGLKLSDEMIHDAVGNCVATIDSNKHTSRFCYDAASQACYIIDPMGGVIGKVYNPKGLCIEERHFSIPLVIEEIHEFTLAHIEPLLSPSDEDKMRYYTYDADDNLLENLDENGKLTTYKYNAQGKKTHELSYATPLSKSEFNTSTRPAANPKDRQSAWFYDGSGNERFAINGEGIVTEQCWNAKGWLIEERTYATAYFDYDHCPSREALTHSDDHFLQYLHDAFGRIIFEINGEGYVTEHEYRQGDEPTTSWFYPQKIRIPQTYNLTSLRELLPVKEDIPSIQVEYDAAFRKIAAIDQLEYREEFKLDALNNLREHIDKAGNSWTYTFDAADRKIEEATPLIEVTSVNEQGQIIKPEGMQRIIQKTEYDGDILRITEAYGTAEARAVEFHQNLCKQTVAIVQKGVAIYDNTQIPTRIIEDYTAYMGGRSNHSSVNQLIKLNQNTQIRPEVITTLSTKTLYNTFKKPIVIIDEAGALRFKIYEGDKVRYEVDQEGFVTGYEHNAFANVIKLTRYAHAIELNWDSFASTGIPLSIVADAIKPSKEEDRSIFLEFDNANRPIKTTQDSVFIYVPAAKGDAHYGEFSPVKINEYNAFGEIYCHKVLVDPINNQWDITRTWFNKIGHPRAQVDGLNYLTLFNPDRFGNNKQTIEYAQKLSLSLTAETSIRDLLAALSFDAEYDRIYSNEMDARGDVIKTIQHKVRLYDPELDVSTIPNVSHKQAIEHAFKRNAKGQIVEEVLPNGALIITQYDARNLPVLKTQPARQLESGAATPVITTAYNAFAQPTRITRHYNPYEHDAYLLAHDEDQTHLAGFDARGLQVITVDPEGAVHSQSFTATKKQASSWIWVSGWGANASRVLRRHQTNHDYDKRGIETKVCESIEQGATVTTVMRSNAFGEKTAEGEVEGIYPVYWLHDKTGAVWNTNEQNGVPVITLRDANGQETLSLRSRTRSLNEVLTVADLSTIINLDYRELQRVELYRDVMGNIEAQALPAFKSLKPDAPEPYSSEISCGKGDIAFGSLSLSWPVPDIAGLKAEVTFWPKGCEEKKICLPVLNTATRCGVDVSMFSTDDYQYQIDFYYCDPLNGQREGFPRYRAEGSAFIITELVTETKNLLWHQIDDQRLMFYGELGDVSGIELMQAGQSIGRVALTSMDKPHCWMVDLSDQPSGRYTFHLLRGYSLLDDQPIKIGVPSPKGNRIDTITTNLSQVLRLNFTEINAVVTSTWSSLPPNMTNLYHELTVINTFSTTYPEVNAFANYTTQKNTLAINTSSAGSSQYTIQNNIPINKISSFYSCFRFSETVSRNRLFTIDATNTQRTVAEIVNPLMAINASNSSFLYVQPGSDLPRVDALREHFPDGHLGKTIALSPWLSQSSRCASSFANDNAYYDLISLQANVPDPAPCAEITIHTANTQSKQILVREIVLTNTMVSKIKTCGSLDSAKYNERHALNFKWTLPDFLANHPIKANFQLRFNHPAYINAYGNQYTFEYVVGRGFQMPYNGHLLPYDFFAKQRWYTPSFSDFDLNSLKLYVQYNEDWIPLLNSTPLAMDRTIQAKPFYTSMEVELCTLTYTNTITQYAEGDVASFSDTYTLLIYPLPAGLDGNQINIQYWDTSGSQPDWRSIPNLQYTGHAIAGSAEAILPGNYPFRIKAKNIYNNYVDFSGLAKPSQDNWWELGSFAVTHGGTLTSVKHTAAPEEVVRPVRKQALDRWRNVLNSTNASGHTTSTIYNSRNKALKTIEPPIKVTDEQGVKSTIAPHTHLIYDLNDEVIAVCDPNAHITHHERDNDGKTLKTILPDGAFKRFIPDIFGRTMKTGDPFEQYIRHQYDRCNREIVREDACNWLTGFGYNELGDRLYVTANDGTETERYDYRHPSRQPTHHYLPEGDAYTTIKVLDRHGIPILEELPNGRTNTWELDAFGNVNSHTDLGGSITTYTRNPFYLTEVAKVCSTNKGHGNRRLEDGSIKPMAEQALVYQYDEASHEIAIEDNALPLTTLRRIDVEGRRARETFRASDGHIHQAVLMRWNEVGWLEQIRDTIMVANYTHDAKGNRRSTIGSVYWNNKWSEIGEQYWYTYTPSDSMAICRGLFDEQDRQIKIGPNRGMMLLYDAAGRRYHELTMKTEGSTVDKTLYYHANNLLRNTISTTGELSNLEYDGKVARRRVLSTNTTRQVSEYRKNGWLLAETFSDDNQSSSTSYTLNRLGLPTLQTTKVLNKEKTDGYDDVVETSYDSFDNDKTSSVEGTRQRLKGEKSHSVVNIYNDPNGNTEFVTENNQELRRFITNSNNRIVLKKVGLDKKGYYFYTTTGQPLAYFGNMPRESLAGELTYADFDLNNHPVSEHFPPPTPGSCVVMENDSFASISERVYGGDSSFASLIADENGFSPEDSPRAGLTLRIPNIVNTNLHNWDGLYPTYNPTAIIGSLYPNMPMPQRMLVAINTSPQRRSHKKFWHILVEAIVGAVIMAFAPELAGAFSTIFGELLGQLLGQGIGYALAGAASSFAQQEIAIGFGDQSKMSLKSIGQSALLSMGTAGIARWLGIDLAKAPQYRGFLNDALKNVELTLATQGLSFATGQQRHFDWRIMLASLANTLANVGAKQINLGAPAFNDVVATASASVASIGVDKMLGNDINMEAIAANTLGTFIGNQAAAQTKQHFAEYQAKKAMNKQYSLSQLPEIQQELAQSEQSFLESIKYHPHRLGNTSSEPTSQHQAQPRKTPPASQHRPDNESVNRKPRQPHLKAERAREEEILTKSSQKANAQSRTQVQQRQPTQSQHKIMDMLNKAGNSRVVHLINEVGDRAVHTILDMVDPVKIVKSVWSDANDSVAAYRTGHILKGTALMGLTALDVLPFSSVGSLAASEVKCVGRWVSAAGSKLGFFGGKTVVSNAQSARQISSVSRFDSNIVNATFATPEALAKGWLPPYPNNRILREVTLGKPETFLRVHVYEDIPVGGFIFREKELRKLGEITPESMRLHLGLKDTPHFISKVFLGTGDKILMGRIGPQPSFGLQGISGYQYQLRSFVAEENFTNTRRILELTNQHTRMSL